MSQIASLEHVGDGDWRLYLATDIGIANCVSRAMQTLPVFYADSNDEIDTSESSSDGMVNTSRMITEQLLQRISLVPLTSDEEPPYNPCAHQLGMSLALDASAEHGGGARMVTSGDLQSSVAPYLSPATPDIPLVRLEPGERVKIRVKVERGTKLSPVTHCTAPMRTPGGGGYFISFGARGSLTGKNIAVRALEAIADDARRALKDLGQTGTVPMCPVCQNSVDALMGAM